MDKPSLYLIHGTDHPAREHALQSLFAVLKAPDATVAEANLRMRAWLAASRRPALRLAHTATPSAPLDGSVPSESETQSLLALGDSLLGDSVPLGPSAQPQTRV